MGYQDSGMSYAKSELRVPAAREYIVVVKRAAAGFAAAAGLHLEALDDVVIATAHACEHAIDRLQQSVGEGCGQLRLEFGVGEGRLDVQVRSVCSRAEVEAAQHRAEERRRADEARRNHELAIQLMGLFVDDFGCRVDNRTGGMRVHLTKYKVS